MKTRLNPSWFYICLNTFYYILRRSVLFHFILSHSILLNFDTTNVFFMFQINLIEMIPNEWIYENIKIRLSYE